MTANAAHELPAPRHLHGVRRLSTNASVAALVAGMIAFGQWLVVDRPQQDRVGRLGVTAMQQTKALSLADKVETEIEALEETVAAQNSGGKPLQAVVEALGKAQALQSRAFDETYEHEDYARASDTLLESHRVVLNALCLEQHFPTACKVVDYDLAPAASTTR